MTNDEIYERYLECGSLLIVVQEHWGDEWGRGNKIKKSQAMAQVHIAIMEAKKNDTK